MFTDNPLLLKEIRTRLRTRTMLFVELLYVVLICGLVFLGMLLTGGLAKTPAWELGASLFTTIAYVQALLMFFVAPLVCASAITGEKEEKTWDSLCVAPVSVGKIVREKLAASLTAFVLLILVSLPFSCAAFILGGVALDDLGITYAYTLVVTVAMGMMGLYWSTRFERSIASVPAAAVTAVLILVMMQFINDTPFRSVALISPTVFLQSLGEAGVVRLFDHAVPVWAPAAWFLLLGAMVLPLSSITRLRFPSERTYLFQRILGWLLFTGFMAFSVGEQFKAGQSGPANRNMMSGALATMIGILLGIAPLYGASVPVARSLRRPGILWAALQHLLLTPWWYMVLLLFSLAPMVWVGQKIAPLVNVPGNLVWLVFPAAGGLAVITWTALTFILADRKTAAGRYVGMIGGYLVAGLVTLGPFIAVMASMRGAEALPRGLQILGLCSPLTLIYFVSNPYEAQGMFGSFSGLEQAAALTCGFYLLLSLILVCTGHFRLHRNAGLPSR